MKHNIGVSSVRGANCFRDAQKFFYVEVATLQFDNLCLRRIKLSDEKKRLLLPKQTEPVR